MSGVTQENEIRCDSSEAAVPSAIDYSTTQGSIISNITDEEPVTPAPSYPVLAPVDFSLPLTPPSRVLVMPSGDLIAEGYDSDYQLGPFFERLVEEENLVSVYEFPLEAPEVISVPEEGGVELSPDPVLDDNTIKEMKVSELRFSLQAHSMSKNGLKAFIIDRLKTAVAKGVVILQYFPVAEIENSAGDVFHPGAHWKELEQAGPDMDNSIMNVEGVCFIAPTTTAKDDAEVFMDRPKKKNYEETFDRAYFTAPARLIPDRNVNGKESAIKMVTIHIHIK